MTGITVEVLGRRLGTAMASDQDRLNRLTVYAFNPAAGVDLPSPCDLVIDFQQGWVIPIKGEGGGEVVPRPARPIDLLTLLGNITRPPASEAT